MRRALQVVAVLNADVKGEAANPSFALERAVQARTVRGEAHAALIQRIRGADSNGPVWFLPALSGLVRLQSSR